ADRAEAEADADLGIDNGVAGGADNILFGKDRFFTSQHSPTQKFHYGGGAESATVDDGIAGADTVSQNVARELGAANWNPVAELSVENQTIRQVLVVEKRRLEAHMICAKTAIGITSRNEDATLEGNVAALVGDEGIFESRVHVCYPGSIVIVVG